DDSSFKDLSRASDFRLRVAAALALGKSKEPGSRQALEKALGDSNAAVRTAAAAALGALGDAAALPALKAALARETPDAAKARRRQGRRGQGDIGRRQGGDADDDQASRRRPEGEVSGRARQARE